MANRRGVKNYCRQELNLLMDLVEERLPLGQADWQAMELVFNQRIVGILGNQATYRD